MSQKDDTVTTQSDEAGSAVLSDTILESQLEEIKRDSRGKVSGKFLRLTMAHNDRPVFIRAENIGAYHDIYDDLKGFQGCWLTGTTFGFSVKEYAQDIQALIAQVEGGPSADALSQVLVSIFVAAGMNTAQAAALLAEDRAADAVQAITELCERLIRAEAERPHVEALHENLTLLLIRILGHWTPETREGAVDLHALNAALPLASERASEMKQKAERCQREQADREMFGQRHEALMQAGDKILQALGITSEQFDDEAGHGLDDHGAMLRMLARAVELIGGLKERADNAEIDANDLRKKLLQHRSDQEKLTSACHTVLQALGIATEPDPALGHDKHSHLLLALTVAAERIEALQADAAKDASLAACIEQQQVEIERQQEEIEKQRRDIEAFRADAGAYLKTADSLRARLAEALRQLPEPVQRDLERVWANREAAGEQS